MEDERTEEEFRKANVVGIGNALAFSRRCGIKRLVVLSSISVYEWNDSLMAREESAVVPSTQYGRSKLAGESVCDEVTDIEVVILRLATVFGPGDTGNLYRMSRVLKRGLFFFPSDTVVCKSLLPLDLAIDVILAFSQFGGAGGRVFNVALPEAQELGRICEEFCASCGFPKARRMGSGLLAIGGLCGDFVSILWPTVPLTSVIIGKMRQSTVVSTDRLYSRFPDLVPVAFGEWVAKYSEYYRGPWRS
jgi:nucleoside-diphosphate-sugar epimerase